MARLQLSFTDDDMKGFEPIPVGVYTARVDASEVEVTKSQKGDAMFKLAFIIEGHPEYTGRKLFSNFMLEGKGKPITARMLKALGKLEGPVANLVLDTNDLHNSLCQIKVGQSEYEGVIRNDIKQVMPPKDAAPGAKKSKLGF